MKIIKNLSVSTEKKCRELPHERRVSRSLREGFYLSVSILLFLLMFPVVLNAQSSLSLEASKALDEWRWGVIAYNDGLPGKSLLAFERAVSLNPTDPLIREWLGRAYWRSGLEDAALDVWNRLAAEGEASSALLHRAETVRRRLSGEAEIPLVDEWIPLVVLNGMEGEDRFFERPSVARSMGDGSGSLLVASYAGGEVLRLDANGTLIEQFPGGLEGFDRPFDVLNVGDGRLLVSEFQADRISVLSLEGLDRGYRIDSWGSSGRGVGELLGPQYMALSADGEYVYVSDWGNRRVVKWSLDGEHVLSLEKGSGFAGFEGPAGIACIGDRVYVADSLLAEIFVFDTSGNFLGSLVDEDLNTPEGLVESDNNLIIADGNRIMQVNLETGELSVRASLGAGVHRITSVFPDDNGNLAVSDFNADQIVLLTPLSTLYGGLQVTLDRVRADTFPELVVDLTVVDRKGYPISGLNASNFTVFDGEQPIGSPELDWSSSDDRSVSLVAITDLWGSSGEVAALSRGVRDLVQALDSGDSLSLVTAGNRATLRSETLRGLSDTLGRLPSDAIGRSPVLWDEALRLAASQLAPTRERKAVVAFVTENPASSSFDRYGLVETARLMANNGVVFYPVYASGNMHSRELDYIAEQTGGKSQFLFQPEGSAAIVVDLKQMSIGRYTLVWQTPRSAGFGREYLPVSVEVIYINKSGRDQSGSFAPLR